MSYSQTCNIPWAFVIANYLSKRCLQSRGRNGAKTSSSHPILKQALLLCSMAEAYSQPFPQSFQGQTPQAPQEIYPSLPNPSLLDKAFHLPSFMLYQTQQPTWKQADVTKTSERKKHVQGNPAISIHLMQLPWRTGGETLALLRTAVIWQQVQERPQVRCWRGAAFSTPGWRDSTMWIKKIQAEAHSSSMMENKPMKDCKLSLRQF